MDFADSEHNAHSGEDWFERKRLLREHGINPRELTHDEVRDLSDDLRNDRAGNDLVDTDDGLSDVVSPEEADGSD
jgi:hypothetical protein